MASQDVETGYRVKIIHAGLFRMGTKSLAEAYQILGIKTFHALDDPMGVNWKMVEEAAEATWPFVPEARPRPPFTRVDWDELWGNQHDAFCDLSAPFTLELFKVYLNSKVVIVQRNFDSWWPSFKSEIVDKLFPPLVKLQIFIAWHLLGYRAPHAMRKLLFGLFHAKSKAEIVAHGRKTYNTHFQEIRSTVPPERLLEYKLGSGWEPLCEFLGKDVPDVPFPRSNEQESHSNDVESRRKKIYLEMAKKAGFWGLGIVILGAAWLLIPK